MPYASFISFSLKYNLVEGYLARLCVVGGVGSGGYIFKAFAMTDAARLSKTTYTCRQCVNIALNCLFFCPKNPTGTR